MNTDNQCIIHEGRIASLEATSTQVLTEIKSINNRLSKAVYTIIALLLSLNGTLLITIIRYVMKHNKLL